MTADDLIKDALVEESVVPAGDCFRFACQHAQQLDRQGKQSIVYHAMVRHPWSGKRYAHAWVEHDGHAIDWQSHHMQLGKKHTVQSFRETFQPREIKKYTPAESLRKTMRAKHYGPW